jgi:hypothetical protein
LVLLLFEKLSPVGVIDGVVQVALSGHGDKGSRPPGPSLNRRAEEKGTLLRTAVGPAADASLGSIATSGSTQLLALSPRSGERVRVRASPAGLTAVGLFRGERRRSERSPRRTGCLD